MPPRMYGQYRVTLGDNYQSIAEQLLGDPTRDREIMDLNPGVTNLHTGQTLTTPAARPGARGTANRQGTPRPPRPDQVGATPGEAGPQPGAQDQQAGPPRPPSPDTDFGQYAPPDFGYPGPRMADEAEFTTEQGRFEPRPESSRMAPSFGETLLSNLGSHPGIPGYETGAFILDTLQQAGDTFLGALEAGVGAEEGAIAGAMAGALGAGGQQEPPEVEFRPSQPEQNPLTMLKAKYLTDPRFTLRGTGEMVEEDGEQYVVPGAQTEYMWYNVPEARRQMGEPLPTVIERFQKQAQDWELDTGEGIPLEDWGDVYMAEWAGLIESEEQEVEEPEMDLGGYYPPRPPRYGGGGGGGGFFRPPARSRARQVRGANQVSWRF